MSNGKTRSINYTPRYTQTEAYDLLPRELRDVLKEGAQPWDTVWFLNQYRKRTKTEKPAVVIRDLVRMAEGWHARDIAEGKCWRDRKPGQKWSQVPQSPHNQAGATMQMSGY